MRVKPILEEVLTRMVPEEGFDVKKFIKGDTSRKIEADMKIVLGYLNQ